LKNKKEKTASADMAPQFFMSFSSGSRAFTFVEKNL